MIPYPSQLQPVAAGHTGLAPVHLLDVYDTNGNIYYWGSHKMNALTAIDAASIAGGAATSIVSYLPWIVSVPELSFHRSLQTDMGSIEIQYLSGDTLQRDFDRLVRSSALEGALFVYRYWHAAAEYPLLEMHGTLSIISTPKTTATIQAKQMLNPSADPTPQYSYSEFCPWRWGSAQCGSTASTECEHSFPSCQVVERILAISNSYEKNFGEAAANVSVKMMNRARKF